MEYHPRIDVTRFPLHDSKIILGSFPTWPLTNSDEDDKYEKELVKSKNGDFDFFYGSSSNQFWTWYQRYTDDSIVVNQFASIIPSLRRKNVGITDVIIRCKRKNRSPLDKCLSNRVYNHSFFRRPSKGETIRILCTSKGVMNEMLLNRLFFNKNPDLRLNNLESDKIQKEILRKLVGDYRLVNRPFYQIVETHSGGKIECFALPSPGSPYRRLVDFGKCDKLNDDYLNRYLQQAFDWFNFGIV
jgi:hypothetical protein